MFEALERVLYIWAVRHPAAGYVQGINDLATPFYWVALQPETGFQDPNAFDFSKLSPETLLDVEADCFWMLTKILSAVQENFIFAQPGIQKMLFQLEELMKRIDGIVDSN
jgi:hypothetical protein